jgi:hypothetical protein
MLAHRTQYSLDSILMYQSNDLPHNCHVHYETRRIQHKIESEHPQELSKNLGPGCALGLLNLDFLSGTLAGNQQIKLTHLEIGF